MRKRRALDRDIKVIRATVRALDTSSSLRMLRANLEYLWDRYLGHPSVQTLAPWKGVKQPSNEP